MDQESITRGLISGIVDHYIREVTQDPNRSVRKLLDMAERTSDGPTQKICYQMMQQMAANQSSPYYEMIHHLVTHTDPRTIRQFGINLGHNAWTFGSGNIRRIVSQSNPCLSWAVFFDRAAVPERIPFSAVKDIVKRGRKLDIYAWLILASDSLDEWNEYTELFRENPDSVFGLYVLPGVLKEEILEEAADIPNLMFFLSTDEPDWQIKADELSDKKLLYSAARIVSNDAQAEEILSGSWLEELVPCHPLMAFSIAADTLSEETARTIKNYMWSTRLDQLYPILPADLISDFVVINHLITNHNILYRVNADGSVSAARELLFEGSSLKYTDLFVS